MDSIKLQRQLRHNQEELISYIKDINSWEDEMKRKEAELTNAGGDTVLPPIRSKKGKTLKPKGKSKVSEIEPVKSKRISSFDYSAWDKFDVEAACDEVENKSEQIGDKNDMEDKQQLIQKACFEKEKGNRFVKEKKWTEAIKCYSEAIKCNSQDPIYHANRALCYLKLKKYNEVENDCTNALKLDPTYVKAMQRRAAARTAKNEFDKAYNDLKQILEIEPHNKESQTEFHKLAKQLGKSELVESSASSVTKTKNNVENVPLRNPIQSKWPLNVWPGEQNVNFITPIKKPPHLRSKKKLVRVPVMLDDTENVAKVEETSPTLSEISDISNNIKEEFSNDFDNSECDKINYQVPSSCLQFNTDWKNISESKNKFLYLMQIPPEKIPYIFQEFFESDFFTDIIKILAKHFKLHNRETILSYLHSISKIKRFSTLIMFISPIEKAELRKIFDYYECLEDTDINEVISLKHKYEIDR